MGKELWVEKVQDLEVRWNSVILELDLRRRFLIMKFANFLPVSASTKKELEEICNKVTLEKLFRMCKFLDLSHKISFSRPQTLKVKFR